MKKILKPALFLISISALTTSCVTYDDAYYGSDPVQNSVNASQTNRQHKLTQQKLEQLTLQLASISETELQNSQRIAHLEEQLASITSQLGSRSGSYSKLSEQLKAERKERERINKAMQNQFSKELAKTETSLRKRQNEVIKAIAETPASSGNFNVYTVRSGDTLSVISKATGVSVKNIKKINRLSSDIIRVGQKLKIPSN
ncbi:MAG: LysM peptidoglycan-binding domain-containing protein [Lentisphaeria bacterium]|nr:LysM peptidoglycan-binding domain-containing protein [Lentisphaeria bacterium]